MKKLGFLLLITVNLFPFSLIQTIKQVKHHEGYRPSVYIDANNHMSIGYGTNLTYLTEEEATLLLVHRLSIGLAQLNQHKWFTRLSQVRKQVILNMRYQLGMNNLLQFKRMIKALNKGYYQTAAKEMKQSKWYKQSGVRAKELVYAMKYNIWRN